MKTDRSKRPKCRWCGRTIVKCLAGWRHKHTQRVECTKQLTGHVVIRVAMPPEEFVEERDGLAGAIDAAKRARTVKQRVAFVCETIAHMSTDPAIQPYARELLIAARLVRKSLGRVVIEEAIKEGLNPYGLPPEGDK